ncbi:hypothetical protein Taro_005233 [Colocasia esculenta]|uniref:DUF7705 domain-containing protein n=1 Tax=Colocasia esculenta TaxID=4460 RepID=A0A843TKE7_COLES|nr:hypothetical protein [Colocasia esculenta]
MFKSAMLRVLSCLICLLLKACVAEYVSAIGDPRMRRDGLRVAMEGWNFCNEVGDEAPGMGSPRAADCFDLHCQQGTYKPPSLSLSLFLSTYGHGFCFLHAEKGFPTRYNMTHLVTEKDNKLGVGDCFDGVPLTALRDVDLYAVAKELYLGGKCQVEDDPRPWQFWMIMLKNGNLDTAAVLCPENGKKAAPFPPEPRFPCFGPGCMNQPLVFHNYTTLLEPAAGRKGPPTMRGRFFGTYDLDADLCGGLPGKNKNISYYSVTWEKEVGRGSWVFHHYLRTSEKYPWLMLYLRSDATTGLSGGYHYPTRGMSKIIPQSPDFMVRVTLEVKQGGGPKSQFYLMDMGGCWKNDGRPCDGDVTSDVTRYSEMIINPETTAWCAPDNLGVCPPYHTLPDGTRIHRNDTARFPYAAYHVYCSPGNGQHLEEPYNLCDAYSNPQPQEILQILPHPAWGAYGYPTKQGEGWVGDPRTWVLNVGGLSQALYFYQDPGTAPARRQWTSLDVGTEIYVSDVGEVAEWTVSDFDVIVPKQKAV